MNLLRNYLWIESNGEIFKIYANVDRNSTCCIINDDNGRFSPKQSVLITWVFTSVDVMILLNQCRQLDGLHEALVCKLVIVWKGRAQRLLTSSSHPIVLSHVNFLISSPPVRLRITEISKNFGGFSDNFTYLLWCIHGCALFEKLDYITCLWSCRRRIYVIQPPEFLNFWLMTRKLQDLIKLLIDASLCIY